MSKWGNMKSIAFFFGSGISYDSYAEAFGIGAGTVDRISWRIFNEPWQYVAGSFVSAPANLSPLLLDAARRAQELLIEIKREVDAHLWEAEGRESHYEDIYAAAWHIRQDLSREIISPLIRRSTEAIRRNTAHLWAKGPRGFGDDPFLTLVDKACTLIQSVVVAELGRAVKPRHLDVISGIAERFHNVDVFTLNHDTLIEQQLRQTGHRFHDGYGEIHDGYRIFDPDWLKEPEKPAVRILKLHGGINSYYCHFKRMRQYALFDRSPSDCFDDDGSRLDTATLPAILTGNTVKEQAYGYNVIGETFALFRKLSAEHSRMICCGYGWADKGINIRIDQWLNDRPERRLIILHSGPIDDITCKRFWASRWHKYSQGLSPKVKIHPKWLSRCTPDELVELLK